MIYYYKQNLKDRDIVGAEKTLHLLFKASKSYYNKLLFAKLNNSKIVEDKLDIMLGSFLKKSIAGNLNINYTNYLKSKDAFKKPFYRTKFSEFFIAFFGNSFRIVNDKIYIKLNKKELCFTITKNFLNMNYKVKSVRLHKDRNGYYICYEYNKDNKVNNGNINASLDLGVDCLMTVYTNLEYAKPLIIAGKFLKYINYKTNKKISVLDSKKDKKFIDKIYFERQNKVKECFNFALKRLFDYLNFYNVKYLHVGDFHGIKEKTVAANFYNISYYILIQKLRDYCKKNGIILKMVNESYSSSCSFLDFEDVNAINADKKRRVNRGLFITNKGCRIHADVNGSANILVKSGIKVYYRNNVLLKPFYITLHKKKRAK